MDSVSIQDYIDNPPQVLFWEADEIAPVFVLAGIGIITHTLTWMLIPAVIFHKYFTRFKDEHMPGYLMHLMYRIGLLKLNKKFNNGAITYFLT